AGLHDVRARDVLCAAEPAGLGRDGLAEPRGPPRHGVLVDTVGDGATRLLLGLLRCVEVGEALSQVDRAVFVGEARHLADDGFGEVTDAGGAARPGHRQVAHMYPAVESGSFSASSSPAGASSTKTV